MALRQRYEASWILLYCFIEMNVTLNYFKYGSSQELFNRQDCLHSLRTITKELKFIYLSDTLLIFRKLLSNHSLVNEY